MKKHLSPLDLSLRILLLLGVTACFTVMIIASLPGWKKQGGTVFAPVTAQAVPEESFAPIPPVSGKININTAGYDELCTLYGIGPSKANAILAYREANGPFCYPQDLTYVSGIGETIYENNKDLIGI